MAISIGDALLFLKADGKQLDSDLDNAGKKTESWASSLGSKLSGLVSGGVQLAITGVVAAGVAAIAGITAVVAATVTAVNTTRQWANTLDSLGDVLGTNARDSAALAVAIQNVGGNVDAITAQFTFMARGLETAKGQLGPTGLELKALGVSVYDANGNLKSLTDIASAVANKFATMPDGIEKSALMTRVMGRSGKDLSDVMNELANGGLAKADAQARKMGLSMSDADVAMSKGLDRTIINIGQTFQGFAVTIGTAVMPQVKMLADLLLKFLTGPDMVDGANRIADALADIVKAIVAFVQENNVFGHINEFIMWLMQLKRIVEENGDTIKAVFSGIVEVIRGLLERAITIGTAIINWFAQQWQTIAGTTTGFVNGLKSAWTTIYNIWLAYSSLIMSYVQSGDWANLGKFLLLTIAQGVAGIIAKLGEIFPPFKALTDTLRQWWTEHGDSVRTIINALWVGIQNVFNGILQFLKDHNAQIQNTFSAAWDFVTRTFGNAFKAIGGAVDVFAGLLSGDWDKVGKGLRTMWEANWDQLLNIVNTVGRAILNLITDQIERTVNAWKNFFAGVASWGGQFVASIWNGISNAASSFYNNISRFFTDMVQRAKDAIGWHSPPAAFLEIGAGIANALAIGIGSKGSLVHDALANVLAGDLSVNAMGLNGSALAGLAGRNVTNNFSQTINTSAQHEPIAADFWQMKAQAS